MKVTRLVASLLPALALLLTLSRPVVRAADDMPAVGAPAPDFTLSSQLGKNVSLHDFKGQWVVLYFYPKDMTVGCTIEAHNFQRDQDQYTAKKAAIVGVSVDTVGLSCSVLHQGKPDVQAAGRPRQESGGQLRFAEPGGRGRAQHIPG